MRDRTRAATTMYDTDSNPSARPSRSDEDRRIPSTWCTTAILIANVIVFAAMVAQGSGVMDAAPEILHDWGAIYGPDVARGEWWRVVTGAFLHGGLVHLAVNMYSLHAVGRSVELFYGRVPFLVLYFVSAVVASFASLAWNPDVFSVGASGAIFGLFGAIGAFFVANRRRLPPQMFRAQMGRMGMVLAVNLLIGLQIPHIDHAAHAGGLIAGFGGALVIVRGTRTGRLKAHMIGLAVVVALLAPIVYARLAQA